MIKRISSLLLVCVMVISLSSCGTPKTVAVGEETTNKDIAFNVYQIYIDDSLSKICSKEVYLTPNHGSGPLYTDKAEEGNEFISIFFKIRNDSKEDIKVDDYYLQIVYGDGNIASQELTGHVGVLIGDGFKFADNYYQINPMETKEFRIATSLSKDILDDKNIPIVINIVKGSPVQKNHKVVASFKYR